MSNSCISDDKLGHDARLLVGCQTAAASLEQGSVDWSFRASIPIGVSVEL